MRFLSPIFAVTCLLIVPCLAKANVTISDANPDGVRSLYVQSTALVSTTSSTPTLVPGMQLTLPASSRKAKFALVTFNAPTTVSSGPFCLFGIYVGSTQYAVGFTPSASPITLVTKIPLRKSTQPLQVDWNVNAASGSCALGYAPGSLPAFDSLTVILSAD